MASSLISITQVPVPAFVVLHSGTVNSPGWTAAVRVYAGAPTPIQGILSVGTVPGSYAILDGRRPFIVSADALVWVDDALIHPLYRNGWGTPR